VSVDDVDRSEITEEEFAVARRYAMVIEWSDADNAFIVSAPDLVGLHTHGATREDAARMGEEVIAIWLSAHADRGLPIPPPQFTALGNERRRDAERVRRVRRKLAVSQRDFANLLNVSVGAVRAWEQGLRTPDGASARLLEIAEQHPEVLLEVA
jgi:predicted RNase H-like HicB family nuclease/DNA-binding XRE family transcriptional regulator